uniref:Uncharacterized protein n=1 Tax=Branchiostoma floridae TaxID=7739 RepID=C3ZWF5_BRAFL|eukprot:XP_002587146.1 hypothetical protein BRAFLDRAFT_102235 [Branchiostoma floridae]
MPEGLEEGQVLVMGVSADSPLVQITIEYIQERQFISFTPDDTARAAGSTAQSQDLPPRADLIFHIQRQKFKIKLLLLYYHFHYYLYYHYKYYYYSYHYYCYYYCCCCCCYYYYYYYYYFYRMTSLTVWSSKLLYNIV